MSVIPDGFEASMWFAAAWPKLSEILNHALARGKGGVHRKGGLGRAGTSAALLLAGASEELSPEEVIERIREARSNAIETVA